MLSKTLTLASLIAAIPSAFAIPEVTTKELPATCSSYPGYNADTGVAGPWLLQLVDSENAAIDGFGDTTHYSVGISGQRPTLRWGSIVFPTRNDLAKQPLECSNNTLLANVPNDLTAAGAPTNVQWTPLVLSPYPYDAALMWKISGEPVKIYEHYVGEEKQDGVFLGGYDGATAWGFKYYPADQGSYNQDYYYMRLLPAGQELQANETRGFVKIHA